MFIITTTLLPLLAVIHVAATPIKRQVVISSIPEDQASVTSTTTATAISVSDLSAPSLSATTEVIESTTSSASASASAPSTPDASAVTAEAAVASGDDTSVTSAGSGADLTVFAALAESLESSFYAAALAKFDAEAFTSAGFADGQRILDQISVIQADEMTHLSTLQAVAESLGGSTADVDSCTFNFDAALTDVPTFLATARILEFIGVDAYIGGATLIEDKSLLVSAAEILTVEARHNTVLNTFNGGSSIPNAFDMILTPQQVLSVAAPFISGGCDPVAALGLEPTPQLLVTNTEVVTPGTLVTFGGTGLEGKDQSTLFCNMIIGGATEALVFPVGECVVPEGLDGPVHLFVTNAATPLSANIVNQDANLLVAGPAITFIDTIPNAESTLLRSGGGATGQIDAGDQVGGAIQTKKIVITKIIVKNS